MVIELGVLLVAMAPAQADSAGYRGVDLFDAVCSACHATGANGAPRVGDRDDWKRRAAQGLAQLTDHALNGIRHMPPYGGESGLSRLDLERAIVYMVNQSGGNWVEPAGTQVAMRGRTGAQIVSAHCSVCHASGFSGAPRIGVQDDWRPRTTLGIDRLVRHAVNGHGQMPSRGGNSTLTEEELRSAVLYMVGSARVDRRSVGRTASKPAEPVASRPPGDRTAR